MPPPLNASAFTAGAVPVTNEKGETTMQKVKVTRYVSGKRPAFAPSDGDESDHDDEFIVKGERPESPSLRQRREFFEDDDNAADPRLLRSRKAHADQDADQEPSGRLGRRIAEPEVVAPGEKDDEDAVADNFGRIQIKPEEDAEDDEDAIAKRRALMRQKAQQRLQTEEVTNFKMESDHESEGDSEYEESESEDDMHPRLKPVFVRKQDRVTLKSKEQEDKEHAEAERKAAKEAEQRRIEAKRIVEQEVKRELQNQLQQKESALDDANFEIPVIIDNEEPEAEYEAWKVRELTRLKRDRDEKEEYDRLQAEAKRLHDMTEEERLAELARNPKLVTNKAQKGKMKFLQKYYHRGVFYLDKEETVLKRDYTAPTLEDHHDKAVLPKVMQVKNFGRAGRTKYTHLVDQDTTKYDSAWTEQTALNVKFFAGKAGGTKQVFDRPSAKRHKQS